MRARSLVLATAVGVQLAAVPPALSSSSSTNSCELWVERSATRVMPDAVAPTSPKAAPVSATVSLAANERESLQVVLRCLANTTASVAMDPLLSKVARVDTTSMPATAGLELSWAQVGYIYAGCMRNSTTFGCNKPQHHWWPDPVVPVRHATLLSGWAHSLWFTVNATALATPGTYSSTITVTLATGEAFPIPLTVVVYGFTLPLEMKLRAFSDLDERGLVAVYPNASKARIHELYLQWGEYLLDHIRINPGTFYLSNPIPVEDVTRWREHGLNFFTVASTRSCNPLHNDTCELDPAKPGLMNETMALIERLHPTIMELRKRGLMNMSSVYGFDESPPEATAGLRAVFGALKKAFPDLPTMTTSHATLTQDYQLLRDANIDLPIVWWGKMDRANITHCESKGMPVTSYFADSPWQPEVNFRMDNSLLDGRLVLWQAFQYNVSGWMYFMADDFSDCCEAFPWPADKIKGSCKFKWHACCATCAPVDPGGVPGRNDWPLLQPSDWTLDEPGTNPVDPNGGKGGSGVVGDAKLMYGGADGKPLPSLRLLQLRDSAEDHAYLALYAEAVGLSAAQGSEVLTSVTHNLTARTESVEVLMAARERLARAIEHAVAGRRGPRGWTRHLSN